MQTWLIVEGVIVVLLVAGVLGRHRLGERFAQTVVGLSALLMVVCVAQWMSEGVGALSLGLGVLAAVLFVYALMRMRRP